METIPNAGERNYVISPLVSSFSLSEPENILVFTFYCSKTVETMPNAGAKPENILNFTF